MRSGALLLAAALATLSGPPALAAPGFEFWQLAARADREDRGGKAARNQDEPEAQSDSRRGNSRDRDRAVRRAQREYGGRVLSVDRVPAEEQHGERYRIKLLSEGNVRTVDVESEED